MKGMKEEMKEMREEVRVVKEKVEEGVVGICIVYVHSIAILAQVALAKHACICIGESREL